MNDFNGRSRLSTQLRAPTVHQWRSVVFRFTKFDVHEGEVSEVGVCCFVGFGGKFSKDSDAICNCFVSRWSLSVSFLRIFLALPVPDWLEPLWSLYRSFGDCSCLVIRPLRWSCQRWWCTWTFSFPYQFPQQNAWIVCHSNLSRTGHSYSPAPLPTPTHVTPCIRYLPHAHIVELPLLFAIHVGPFRLLYCSDGVSAGVCVCVCHAVSRAQSKYLLSVKYCLVWRMIKLFG